MLAVCHSGAHVHYCIFFYLRTFWRGAPDPAAPATPDFAFALVPVVGEAAAAAAAATAAAVNSSSSSRL